MAEEITTNTLWNLLREIGSLSFPSNQSSSAHARPISEATYLVLWLKFSLSLSLTWVNGICSDDTARMLNYLQTVETLIRCRVLRRLIRVWTVCQSPFYGSPNYNGLNIQTPFNPLTIFCLILNKSIQPSFDLTTVERVEIEFDISLNHMLCKQEM